MQRIELCCNGYTRLVVLVGNKAYKIARIRLIWPWIRFVNHLFTGQVKQRLEIQKVSLWGAFKGYLCDGFVANREEWRISQKYHDHTMAKVFAIYLGGLLVVQERGQAVLLSNPPVDHPCWKMMLRNSGGCPLQACSQFAKFSDGVKLVDLGRNDLSVDIFQ